MLVLMKGIFENHTFVVSSGDHYIRILTLVTRKTQVDCILINSSLPLSIFAGRTVQAGLILQLRGIRNRILTKAEHSILVVLVPVSKAVVVFHVPTKTGIKRQIHFNVLITRAHKDLCPPKVKLAGMMKKCKKCRRIFNDHKKNHHILHPVCQICNHMDRTSKTSFDLTCHICLRNFKNKYRLGDHMLTHDDKNPFYCSICEKGFTRKGTYDQHVLLKHSDLQEFYTCDECNQNFSSRSNLEGHSKNKHFVEQTEYACNICTKKFNRRDNLLQHERNEHNLRRNETIIPGINERVFQFPM